MKSVTHVTVSEIRNMCWSLRSIFIASVALLGVSLTPLGASAQSVPSRGQSLLLTRPSVPPPVTPLQREILGLRKNMRQNTIEFERKLERERAIRYWVERSTDFEEKLRNLLTDPFAYPGIRQVTARSGPCMAEFADVMNPFIEVLSDIRDLYRSDSNLPISGIRGRLQALLNDPYSHGALNQAKNCSEIQDTAKQNRCYECRAPIVDCLNRIKSLYVQSQEWRRQEQRLEQSSEAGKESNYGYRCK